MQRKNAPGFPSFFDDILASMEEPCLFLGPASPGEAPSALHFHKHIELGLCFSGRGIFYIHDEIYPFVAGDISIIYPGESHIAQSARNAPADWQFLTVDVDALLGAWQDFPTLRNLAFRPRGSGHILSSTENMQILPYLRRIISLYEQDTCMREEKRGQFEALFACVLYESRDWARPRASADGAYYTEHLQQIYPAVKYVLNHYSEDVSSAQLCACCNLSPVHLRRLFSAMVGVPPIAFLHKIRINHACSELSSTELPIVSIAERCGYTSLSSFNRQFQKIMQISPSEYRAAHRTVAESVKLG